MPTRDRRPFVAQALRLFAGQDYLARELIVVDDGRDRVADLMPDDPRVRYVPLNRPSSIGAKRNLACRLARGEIVAQWDDDDWYGSHRLSHQAAPLLAEAAEISGLETACFLDLPRWQGWACTPELHRRIFAGDVHGGTLVYRRWVWERLATYPDRWVAEDAAFLLAACRRGARLAKLPAEGSFVYVRHGANAWRFVPGEYADPRGWRRVDPEDFMPRNEIPTYRRLAADASNVGIVSRAVLQEQGRPSRWSRH